MSSNVDRGRMLQKRTAANSSCQSAPNIDPLLESPLRRTEAHGQTLHMQHRVQATGCPRLCRRRDAAQPGETPRSAANPDPHLGSEIRGWCAGSAAVDLIAAYEARIARTAGRQTDARNRVPIGICCEIGEPAGLPNAWCRHCTWT